jgi:hypothetical protein
MKKMTGLLVALCFLLGSLGCQIMTPAPTPTPTAPPIPRPTLTMTPTSRPSPTPTDEPPPVVEFDYTDAETVSLAAFCRETMDGLYDLRGDLGLPEHYPNGDLLRRDGEFDPNRYFQVLDHLSLADGYTLEYVYFMDELGGRPMLYANPAGQTAYATYEDFLDGIGASYSGERSYQTPPYAYMYLDYLRADDTPEGFFEFLSMALLGDQFYLFWHALYHDEVFLCDESDLAYVQASMDDFELTFPEGTTDAARALDLSPQIAVGETSVMLRFVWFTKWGGFLEGVYVMDRQDPANLLDVQVNPLIEYDCGIDF